MEFGVVEYQASTQILTACFCLKQWVEQPSVLVYEPKIKKRFTDAALKPTSLQDVEPVW